MPSGGGAPPPVTWRVDAILPRLFPFIEVFDSYVHPMPREDDRHHG